MSRAEQLGEYVVNLRAELFNQAKNGDTSERLDAISKLLGWSFGQLALEREKNVALQTAIVDKLELQVVPSGSPEAKIAPIEKYTGERSDQCVIAFGGMATKLGMPVPEFTRMLTDNGPDVFFVKDHLQAWYQKGLPGASTDVESTAEFLAQVTSGYKSAPKTVGTSAGGFAAILFGVLLGSPAVVAFGPQTYVRPETVSQFASQDTRSSEVLDGQMLDLRTVLQKNPIPDVQIFYGEDCPFDAEPAKYLQGIDGVKLRPCPTDTHNVAAWLREQGKLTEILRRALT